MNENELKGKLDQIRRNIMSINDINHANKIICLILDNTYNNLMRKALIESVIISYSRPFSGNKNPGDIHKSVIREFTDKQKKMHDLVFERRNGIVAHSGNDHYSVIINIDDIFGVKSMTPSSTSFPDILDQDCLKILQTNCNLIEKEIRDKIMVLFQDIPHGTYY